ncbi:MAG: hypothetical protein PVS3B1_07280 [Ktedonobacteraceae bacterium]
MIMMQEREEGMNLMGSPALSLWINEHNIHQPVYDEKGMASDPERDEGALAAYEQAIELAPRAAILHYQKGQVLAQLGRVEEAESAYEEARNLGYNSNRLREEDATLRYERSFR